MSDVVSAQPPILVQKYGGSSVADLAKIQAVAERIRSAQAEGYRLVVVVSAMGNTTNELLALAKGVSETPDRRELDMLISVGERITMSLLAMALKENLDNKRQEAAVFFDPSLAEKKEEEAK